MQITEQRGRSIIDMSDAKPDEMMIVAESLLKMGDALSLHGMTLKIRPRKTDQRRLDKPATTQ